MSHSRVKLSHSYNTRANRQKRMDDLEEENRELREEVSTLKESLEKLNVVIESMAATQNHQRTVILEVV